MIKRFIGVIGLAACLVANASITSPVQSSDIEITDIEVADIEINGRVLGSAELVSLQSRLSVRIGAGRYLVDPRSGCWLNIATGWTGCIGDPELGPSGDGRGKRDRRDD